MAIPELYEKALQVENPSETAMMMYEAALVFLASLSGKQKRDALVPVFSDERYHWDYRPRPRVGLMFKEMDEIQKRYALALLASGLSNRGYVKALTITTLEKLLQQMEQDPRTYNPDHYYVTLFGNPRLNGPWGWRFEGHHISANFLIMDGREIAATPNFFGANPARVLEGPLAGLRVLSAEEDVARHLLLSLDTFRRSMALIDADAPADIITKWNPRVSIEAPAGVSKSEMTPDQQALFMDLVNVYLSRMHEEVSAKYLDKIEKEGPGNIHFAWAGSEQVGQPHYYRIHGPSFLVEYDNIQNNANHIHTVWRDLRNDWGEDLLKMHHKRHHSAE